MSDDMIKNSKAVFFSVVVSHSASQNNKVYSVLSPFLSCTIIHSLSHTVILYFTFIHVFFFSHKLPLPYIHYRAVHTHTHTPLFTRYYSFPLTQTLPFFVFLYYSV